MCCRDIRDNHMRGNFRDIYSFKRYKQALGTVIISKENFQPPVAWRGP